MKRFIISLFLILLFQSSFSQINYIQEKKTYFESNITKLDPIEGVFEWETNSYASYMGQSQSQKWEGISVIPKIRMFFLCHQNRWL